MKQVYLPLVFIVIFFMNSNVLSAQANENYLNLIAKSLPEQYIKSNANLFFTIQVGAYRNKNTTLEKLKNINIVKEEDNLVKYRLGEFLTYVEANDYKKMILTVCNDAFIVVIKNGKRVHIKEAFKEEVVF
jgi:hypothetical protein